MRLKIEELGNHVEVIGGQIMTRITAKDDEPFVSTRKVVIPKAITSDGFISIADMPEENLKVDAPVDRITRENDIVIKLSTPFDSAIVTKETEGCVVPSFCAIIRNGDTLDLDYLRAFLVSQSCKEQLKAKVSGAVMSILSIGKIKSVEIPMAAENLQHHIGERYREAQEKLQIMNQIIALENKRNDVLFQELVK